MLEDDGWWDSTFRDRSYDPLLKVSKRVVHRVRHLAVCAHKSATLSPGISASSPQPLSIVPRPGAGKGHVLLCDLFCQARHFAYVSEISLCPFVQKTARLAFPASSSVFFSFAERL